MEMGVSQHLISFKSCFLLSFLGQQLDIKPPDGLPILTLESSSRDEVISMPVGPMTSWSAVFESLRIVSFCQNTMAIWKYVAHLSVHNDISSACYGESLRHQMLFFTSLNFHSRTKDAGKTPTKNRWLSDVCSLCSDGIQVVSLESFVQGMKTRGAKTGQRWDSFGSDLVGLYWLEFSGYLVPKAIDLMEQFEAQEYRNNCQDKNYYMTSNEFLART